MLWAHVFMAIVVSMAIMVAAAYHSGRFASRSPGIRTLCNWTWGLLILQLVLGFATWLVRQPNENDLLLFNFLDDGSYIHFEVDDDDPEETSGLEWGDYTHDPASGVLTVSGRFDENGSTGLSDAYDPPPNLFLSANVDVLTLEVDEDGDQQIEDSVSFERQ